MEKLQPDQTLGRTGLPVTKLGFGCALWSPRHTHWTMSHARRIWEMALDSGINFFDTAYDYVHSEEWIGKTITGRYEDFYLATKCGCTDSLPTQNSSVHEWTRDNLFRGIETSLRRLKKDSVDILQLHNATVSECEKGGIVEVLNEIKEQGMTKWIGASTTSPHLEHLLDWGDFDVMQIPYSALERSHENLISQVRGKGIGTIIRGGVAQGEVNQGRGDRNIWDLFQGAKLDEFVEENETRSTFVLRFTLSHPDIDTVIVGTTDPEHLKQNINAARKGPLSPNIYSEVKERLSKAGNRPI